MQNQSSNLCRWGRSPVGLAVKTVVLFMAALWLGVGAAFASLLLEVRPADYNTSTKQWPIASGSMAGDYFACAPWAPVSVTSKIYTNNGLGYTAVDFTAANTILGGPLCPASLGGANPKTIEAWVFRPSTVGGDAGMILDLSREDFATPNRQFAFSSSQFGGGGGRALHTTGPGSTIQTWNTSTAARGNNWVHLAASYDGTNLNLYVDGALDKTVAYTYDTETGGSIAIGGFRYGFEGTPHSVGSFDTWTAWRGYLGSIRVYDEARTAGQIAADHALGVNYGEVGQGLPDYTITATVTGGHGTIDPAGAVLVTQGTSKTFTFLADSGYMVDTVTVDGSPVVLTYPGTSYTFSNVTTNHTIDVTYKADPNADILFSLNTDAFSAIADGARITSWSTAVPVGASMPAFSTWNNGLPELGPIVETIGGVKWEQNTRANYDDTVSPTIHMRQDGFSLGGSYSSPIPVNGASIVTVVKPVRKAISDGWNSIVDIFYQKLVLGIRNDNGNIIVWRNGTLFTGPAIPDGQKTILSLVVQPAGQFKVYANGLEVMSTTTTTNMSALVPGSADHEKTIRVGRGYDSWTVFNGNIADTIVFKSAISDTARTALEATLATKFGVALSVETSTITPSAGPHGVIAPATVQTVTNGNNSTFTITPASGYAISQVLVDGVNNPVAVSSGTYTFTNVIANHTISASFINASADPHLLVDLDASTLPDGTLTSWFNDGTLGGTFDALSPTNAPAVATIAGKKSVHFVQPNEQPASRQTMVATVSAPAAITGGNPWTISTDLYQDNMNYVSSENAYFCWAGTDQGAGTAAKFNYLNNVAYRHEGSDGSFATVPTGGAWHKVTITYDGTTERIYVDGALDSSATRALNLASGNMMMVGGSYWHNQRDQDQYWRLANASIARLQVYDRALSSNEVAAMVNHPPVPQAVTMGALSGALQSLPIIDKYPPADPDGHTCVITAVNYTGGQGATVGYDSTSVSYTSSPGFSGTDTFDYTVSDGHGGTGTATVTVNVADGIGFNLLSPPQPIGAGTVVLNYLGIPGHLYALQHTTSLTPPITWEDLVTNAAAYNGSLAFTNASTGPVNYFRTKFISAP